MEIEAAAKAEKRKKILTTSLIAVGIVALVVLIFVFALGGDGDGKNTFTSGTNTTAGDKNSTTVEQNSAQTQKDYKYSIDITKKHHVEIAVKDYGTIKLELDPTYAPITVDNFIKLAESGFYDGLTFHRIIENFMIQGGDPDHNGTGGSDTTILGEFSANGVKNDLSHKRGVISMARSTAMNSASSQFFICHQDSEHLDGKYAAFGYVTEGLHVVDAIAKDAEPTDDNGTIKYEEQPVITTVKVID
ncbi:MAG: peptidylprolyl isomerase [Ruminococcaceae bacterium]|nr:peptidylprolyl isomerase [Oscillospiraceae bacterium]